MKFLLGFDCYNYPIDMSGGMTVLKELVKQLVKLNKVVYVINKQFHIPGSLLISKEDAQDLNNKYADVITIYPEITEGNPFKAKNVVRWILYNTKPEVEKTWEPSDTYFYFNDSFKSVRQVERKILTCLDLKLDLFSDKNQKREGFCHIARYHKGNIPDYLLKEMHNSEDLFQGHMNYGWDWLVDKFNTKKYFITFDKATYYSIVAALCGCISIILDDGNDENFGKNKAITHKYGIAYGFDKVNEAIETSKLLRPYLKEVENSSIETVKNFVSFWEDRFLNFKTN